MSDAARPPWSDRAHEDAHLFNPAFVATLICRMVGDYVRKTDLPMPLSLAFLLVPVVLHRRTRETLPRSTVTATLSWLQDNSEQKATFAGRVRVTRPISQEAIMFAMAHDCLSVSGNGLMPGRQRLPASFSRDPDLTDETRDCLDRAAFLGRWFAAAGTEQTILAAWGVAP